MRGECVFVCMFVHAFLMSYDDDDDDGGRAQNINQNFLVKRSTKKLY